MPHSKPKDAKKLALLRNKLDKSDYIQLIEQLISMVEEGVYIVDKEGTGLFYNGPMAQIENVNIEDVLGKEFQQAFPGVALKDSTLFKALKKNECSKKNQQVYINLRGKQVSTNNMTAPVLNNGKTVAAVEIAKDITNIEELSNTIQDLRQGDAKIKEGMNGSRAKPKMKHYRFEDIIGQNQGFLKTVNMAKRAAENDATVFIYGETGTGKELLAQSIHYDGARKNAPFMAQNCAALPETLLEGILFGTSKGGFTGAVDRAGLFEQASGGTLLLDEISAMPYDLQSKLLRVLQEEYIRRIGGTEEIPIDVHIIATVNEPPEELIASGKLRKDLYYRLNVVNINLPPLRDRKDDIPLLVDAFLDKHCKRFGKELWMVTDEVIKTLQSYNYPGNIRELENIIMQSVALAGNEHVLTGKLLHMPMGIKQAGDIAGEWDGTQPLDVYLGNVEKELIRRVMIEESGVVSRAAGKLQIKRQTLQHKLKKYNMKQN
ncbi:MAG: sigma 54-interacting transcriptional regulator [Clostridiales bacterium]|nr:sigma 54-interacting transcriptional regulator [Clostridiales bacterium]